MKKLLFAVLILSGCQINDTSDNESTVKNISYFKDEKTGLCFATLNSMTKDLYTVTSISCVPCDSLKNIKL